MSKAKQKFNAAMADFVGQNYDQSIDLFSEAITFDPEFKLAIKSRGAAYLRLGNIQKAIADFNRVLELDPHNARTFHLRGLAYEKAGDVNQALVDLNEAIESNPEYGAAYHSRANLYTKMGATEQAAADIQMVMHLSEVNIESFANDNNVWRSRQQQLESISNDDFTMER